MTLELRNVAKRVGGRNSITVKDVNLRVQRGERVALLGQGNSGLKGILAVISGQDAPDEGKVVCTSRLSWPLPTATFFHRHLSFSAAARFVGQLYEVDSETAYIAKVLEMAGIEDLAREKMSACPKAVATEFAFALGACLPFDIYFLTNTSIGGKEKRQKYHDIIAGFGKRSGLLLATSKGEVAQKFCDKAFVFDGKSAVYYEDMDAAVAALGRVPSKRSGELDEDEEEEEEQQRRPEEDDLL